MIDQQTLRRDIFGLVLMLLAALVFVSLISFNVTDNSLFTHVKATEVSNWIGIVGATISSGLYFVLGIVSFLFAVLLFVIGLNVLRGIPFASAWVSYLGLVLLMVFVSMFAGLLNMEYGKEFYFFGGAAGAFFARQGVALTGKFGLYLIDVFCLLIAIVMTFNLSPGRIIEALRQKGEAKKLAKELEAERQAQKEFLQDPDQSPPYGGEAAPGQMKNKRSRKQKPPLFEKVEYVVDEDGQTLPKFIPAPDPTEMFSADEIVSDSMVEEMISDADPPREPQRLDENNSVIDHSDPAIMARDDDFANKNTKKIKSGFRRSRDLPPLSLLNISDKIDTSRLAKDVRSTAIALEEVLSQFDIKAQVINTEMGPVITRYELKMPPGVRVSRIEGLADTIAYNLAATKVRIVAPIPGKAAVGVEIPNSERSLVTLGDLFLKKDLKSAKVLDFYLGLDVTGKPIVPNLKDAPHLIVAGATGQGKSVCLNSILLSFLYISPPEDLRLILVDPKMVEFKMFNGIEHLLTEVITDKRKASLALKWLVGEMERRYGLMEQTNVRDISRYNEKAAKSHDGTMEHIPYIVLVVDELHDLMMVARKDVEESIARLSQKARAAGIHLILATQRPSVDVITGVIKANFPSRIAFFTQSRIDSTTILGVGGAEQLLGKGDMLINYTGSSELVRAQGAYLSEEEVYNVVDYLKKDAAPEYREEIVAEELHDADGDGDVGKDDMYRQAVEIIRSSKKASASYLQRRLQIGYNRAARYIDMMESEGIIGAQNGSKPREVFI